VIGADWGGDVEMRKSTSRYVFLISGTALSWKSSLQKVVAASSMEAEYIAQAFCNREALWTSTLYRVFGYEPKPIRVYADNVGAIGLARENNMTVVLRPPEDGRGYCGP